MNITDHKCLPAIAEEGALIRDLSSGNVYRRDGAGYTYLDGDALAALEQPVAEIAAEPASIPADDPNAAAITPPAAGTAIAGAGVAADPGLQPRNEAATAPEDTGTDANGSPAYRDAPNGEAPPPQPAPEAKYSPGGGLNEDDIEKLSKKRRKEAAKKLAEEEAAKANQRDGTEDGT